MNAQQATTVELNVPPDLIVLGMTPQKIATRWLEWAVIALFQDEVISSGKAARLLGISRREFIVLLGKRGLAYLDQSEDELVAELYTLEVMGL